MKISTNNDVVKKNGQTFNASHKKGMSPETIRTLLDCSLMIILVNRRPFRCSGFSLKNSESKDPKNSWKFSKFWHKIFSRFAWGLKIVKTSCSFIRTLANGHLSGSLIIPGLIPFSEMELKLLRFLRLRNTLWRNRTWRHRSSGHRIRKFWSWSILSQKPFG